jgi:ferrochelatase
LRLFIGRRIATKRAPKATAEYREIGFSPINRATATQAKHLQEMLSAMRPDVQVHVVNRYTAPFADEVVTRLDAARLAAGRDRLFLLALYPHVCHSTTVSSMRDFDLALIRHTGRSDLPSTRVFSWWHHPGYLDLTFARLAEGLDAATATGGNVTVMFSAHGLPQLYSQRGDPYVTETYANAGALQRRGAAYLEAKGAAARAAWHVSFQSRVGRIEWVRPYTDELIPALGKERGGHLVVVPISFTSDHIETLYEMDRTYRDLALASGFTHVTRVKPAGEDPALARCLAELLVQHGL